MIDYLKNRRLEIRDWRWELNLQFLVSTLPLLTIPILYLLTLAQTPVLGDPSEYTFVAHMLGIAHPPGYAFITLVGKLVQLIVPVGSIAWRMHLLAAVSGTAAALFVFGIIRTYIKNLAGFENLRGFSTIAGLFGALTVGTAVNHWQHSIHANPHIMTAVFLAANLYFLTKWWIDNDKVRSSVALSPYHPITPSRRWLYAFCLSAGLGVTHHPLTVMAFPAYAIFLVWVRPSLLRQGCTLLKMVGFALLGLLPWLYFPIRSPMVPGFGPTTMNTLNGFLDHVLARGLSNSLPFFGLAVQPQRALVFWSLLRLQYSWPIIGLALGAVVYTVYCIIRDARQWRFSFHPITSCRPHLITLYVLAFLTTYAFVISLRAQDIMAYLIGPFLVVGLLAGIGLFWLLGLVWWWGRQSSRAIALLALLFLALGPGWQVARNLPHVSLRRYDEGAAYVTAVFNRFDGQNEGAVLLNDWEHMTPLWYTRFVEERWPNAADVRPEFISTGGTNPWLEAIFTYLPGGPVYLSGFRPSAVAGTEFRLRPSGPFYRVLEPGDTTAPPELTAVSAAAGDLELVGYTLPETAVAGEFVPFTLAMRAPAGTEDFYVPVLRLGDLEFEFTTDSHLVTPLWRPGEVIVERFDFALPHDLPGGDYPLTLSFKNLSRDEERPLDVDLSVLSVTAQENPIATGHLLANFRQRVGLVSVTVRGNNQLREAPWFADETLTVQPGDILNVLLEWESLSKAEESYTVFVHLIDAANTPHAALDYTPLGGSAPTHLWIPKWLPGQRYLDPYRLLIEPDLPPGTYFIEVGLYEMVSGRRLHISDQEGNLEGDRFILGSITVTP